MSDAGLGSAIALEAAAGDKFVFTVLEPMVVMGFRILATVAFNYDTMTTAAKVALTIGPLMERTPTGRVGCCNFAAGPRRR
jgi:hypothetical protein